MIMKLSDFDYNLPKKFIAQEPVRPRDYSRLLVLDKKTSKIEHKKFYDIFDYFQKGDLLILNNSKVFPARLIGQKKDTGGKIEVFLHKKIRGNSWQCMLGGNGLKENMEIEFYNKKYDCENKLCFLKCEIIQNNKDGTWNVKFNKSGDNFMKIIYKVGNVPLPPYIKRFDKKNAKDNRNYQTVYADKNKIGSVAAPTAGFHFTSNLIKKLKNNGIQIEYITLHVGMGTFLPVKVDNIKNHKMHSEWVEVKKNVIKKIIKTKKEKKRIIAVGTTSVRTLESMFQSNNYIYNKIQNFSGLVNIFIYPNYKFKIVDSMITNFHLPKSTLLMLVSAFAGTENIKQAYCSAIKNKYRFYSYGDAMLIV